MDLFTSVPTSKLVRDGQTASQQNQSCGKVLLIGCRRNVPISHTACVRSQTVLETIGHNIRTARESRRFSQEELAALSGLHRTYVGGVERGERNLGAINLVRIARALRVEPSTLLLGISLMGKHK